MLLMAKDKESKLVTLASFCDAQRPALHDASVAHGPFVLRLGRPATVMAPKRSQTQWSPHGEACARRPT